MRQLLAHAEKFDLVVGKMEKLRKKIELAVLLQEKLAIMREPFSPSIVFPKIGGVLFRNTRVWKNWKTSTTLYGVFTSLVMVRFWRNVSF